MAYRGYQPPQQQGLPRPMQPMTGPPGVILQPRPQYPGQIPYQSGPILSRPPSAGPYGTAPFPRPPSVQSYGRPPSAQSQRPFTASSSSTIRPPRPPTPSGPHGYAPHRPPSSAAPSRPPSAANYRPGSCASQHRQSQPPPDYGPLPNMQAARAETGHHGYRTQEIRAPGDILPYKATREEAMIRYTAIPEAPEHVGHSPNFKLRQVLERRQTELLIVMTMYNEDDKLFHRTFDAVLKNIENLQNGHKTSKTWGGHNNAWQKIVVCVISDGRSKCDERTKALLSMYGAYLEEAAEATVASGAPVESHVFEFTTRVRVDMNASLKDSKRRDSHVPVQLLVCMKEQNKKKLNSHRWAFDAFATQLNPNVCILLDVGTQPSNTALYYLWKEFDKHPNVGGSCGEITVDLGPMWHLCLNPLVAAQRFEYKMSNILDKPLESMCGFISVLPGAFSAYRWKALQGAPLEAYFLGETMHGGDPKPDQGKSDKRGKLKRGRDKAVSLATTNMYLAEDRILCFEIVTKQPTNQDPNPQWVLKYVKSAKASTDAPDQIAEFISQRRRWNNGSFFASLYALLHFHRIWTSHQSFLRKLVFSIEFFYNALVLLFGYLGLSSFYLAFYFICTSATANTSSDPFFGAGGTVVGVVSNIYIGVLGVTIICSLGNEPKSSKWYYYLCCISFALLFAMAFYCTIWSIYLSVPHTAAGWKDFFGLLDQAGFRNIVIALMSTYGLYLLSSIIFLDPWHMFTCFVQYLFMSPAYICILSIYSFAQTNNLSWGTKGDTSTGSAAAKAAQAAKERRLKHQGPLNMNAIWRHSQETPTFEEHKERDEAKRTADHYMNLRTSSLLTYLGANLAIVMWFTSDIWSTITSGGSTTGSSTNYYVVGIFWSVAVMAAIRFLGSLLYIITFYAGF